MSSAAILFHPSEPFPEKDKPEDRLAWKRFEARVRAVIGYRGGYKQLKRPPRGAALGYLANQGKCDAFNIGEFKDELAGLIRFAAFYPGEYLLIWTYGHAVHHFYISAKSEPKMRETSFRLDSPPSERDKKRVDGFIDWFGTSNFKPDAAALRKELNSSCISVAAWFAAFGISGAREIEAADKAEMWADFERVALSLLSGGPADKALVKKLNEEINDGSAKLGTKPAKGAGATARLIHGAAYTLTERVGPSEATVWKERSRAVKWCWDITDSSDAQYFLTVGTDKKGLGASASLTRLLSHFPPALYRDPIFLALLGMEFEAANGHAFVQSCLTLAEGVQKAGMTITVYPARLKAKFRQSFGMASEVEPEEQEKEDYAAEAFIDIPRGLKADVVKSIESWLKKEKAAGIIARLTPDGTSAVSFFTDGKPADAKSCSWIKLDEKKLAEAGKALDPRAAVKALGLPDLIESVKWEEGSYAGNARNKADHRVRTVEILRGPITEEKIRSWKSLIAQFSTGIRGEHSDGTHEPCTYLTVAVLSAPDTTLRKLAEDLTCSGLIESYGKAWVDNGTVFGFTHSSMRVKMLVRILADLPTGSSLSLSLRPGEIQRFTLDASGVNNAEMFASPENEAQVLEEFDSWPPGKKQRLDFEHDAVTSILFEKGERAFLELDFSKVPMPKAEETEIVVTELGEAGLRHLGDLVCSEFDGIALRSFCAEKPQTYSVAMLAANGAMFLQFVTYFNDGATLTTTTNQAAQSKPKHKMHSVVFPLSNGHIDSKKVWAAHIENVAEYCAENGAAAVAIEPTLIGMSKALDRSIDRESEIKQQEFLERIAQRQV